MREWLRVLNASSICDMIDMKVPAEADVVCSVFRKRTPTETKTEQQVDDRNDCLFYTVLC